MKNLRRLERKEINMNTVDMLETMKEISENQVGIAKEVVALSERLKEIGIVIVVLDKRMTILENHMLNGKNHL